LSNLCSRFKRLDLHHYKRHKEPGPRSKRSGVIPSSRTDSESPFPHRPPQPGTAPAAHLQPAPGSHETTTSRPSLSSPPPPLFLSHLQNRACTKRGSGSRTRPRNLSSTYPGCAPADLEALETLSSRHPLFAGYGDRRGPGYICFFLPDPSFSCRLLYLIVCHGFSRNPAVLCILRQLTDGETASPPLTPPLFYQLAELRPAYISQILCPVKTISSVLLYGTLRHPSSLHDT
jgi:hypothetical protein